MKTIASGNIAVMVVLLLLCAGCVTLPAQSSVAAFSPARYAAQLMEMDASQLQAELKQAESASAESTTADTLARLGLIRGQWGFSGYQPKRAASDLRDALQHTPQQWQKQDRAFVRFQAAQLENIARRENQITANGEHTRLLEQELQEARDKLRAISNIERELGNTP